MATNAPIRERVDESALKTLQERDRRFRGEQGEGKETQILKEAGHPKRAAYERLRDFFDELLFNANRDARYYSFDTEEESTEYWAPKLMCPEINGFALHRRAKCSDKSKADLYRERVVDLNLVEADTVLKAGSWIVDTHDEAFFRAFQTVVEDNLERGLTSCRAPTDYDRRSHKWTRDERFVGRVFCQSVEEVAQVKAVIDEYREPLTEAEL